MKFASLSLFLLLIYTSLNGQVSNLRWVDNVSGALDIGGREVVGDQLGNVYTMGQFQGQADMDPGAGTYFLNSAGDEDIFVQKVDANGDFVWAISIGGPDFDDATGLTIDGAGNLYLTGGFEGVVDFDPGAGVQNATAQANADIFLLKIDPDGELVWVKTIQGGQNEYAEDVALDPWGNIILIGNFEGTMDFDPGAGITQLSSAGGYDIFVLKMDTSGNLVWAKSFPGTGTSVEEGYEVQCSKWGNIYSLGGYLDSVDFDPGPGIFQLQSSGGNDVFLQKMDSAGNLLWARSYGGSSEDYGYGLGVSSLGECIVVGGFSDSANFDTMGTYLQGAGQEDGFVAMVDSSGNLVWVNQVGGPDNDVAKAVHLDSISPYFYVAGEFFGGGGLQYGGALTGIPNVGDLDIFLLGLHSQFGSLISRAGFGGPGEESVESIAVESSSNVILTGAFEDSVDFNPGPLTGWFSSQGGFDSYTVSLDITIGTPEPTGSFISVFPNPNSGTVKIDLTEFGSSGRWSLLDMQGRTLRSEEFTRPEFQLDMFHCKPGMYFLRVSQEDRVETIKILRQ